MQNIGTFIVGAIIIGFAWYFIRTVAKILVNMSKAQENHEEILQALEALKTEIQSLKQSQKHNNKSDLQ
jgi:hypothetical protein